MLPAAARLFQIDPRDRERFAGGAGCGAGDRGEDGGEGVRGVQEDVRVNILQIAIGNYSSQFLYRNY